jgi:HD-GYP domain-containing protein (c-di-GMP phosphodiesterase class II)
MNFSKDHDLNKIITDIVHSFSNYAEKQRQHIKTLDEIGIALSSESNLDKLLEMILSEAKRFTNADGGTLYLMANDEKHLEFTVVETNSLNIKMGGTQGVITWPALPLYKEDLSANREMVAALCALDKKIINIEDVYNATGFNFEGTKKFDEGTGFRSKSMLVIPMINHDKEVIGVCQLINRIDPKTGKVISFSEDDERSTLSLASQAAVAISNAKLIRDLRLLLESFIASIATAIDAKSPYTGGHVRKVAVISMMLVEALDKTTEGKYKNIHYNHDQKNEIRIAALMHDVGKITTPEYVVDKSTKLEAIFDRIELIEARADVLKKELEINYLKALLSKEEESALLEDKYRAEIAAIEEDIQFVQQANIGGEFMRDDDVSRIEQIAKRSYMVGDIEKELLSKDEVLNLTIRKGTLTDIERQKIQDHAQMSLMMLQQLPFPKKLQRVPEIAGGHHEKLNGKGYPQGLTEDQLSLESRILAIADILEALTASDRPYKDAKKMSEVIRILNFMVKDGELDAELLQFFYDQNLHLEYAKQELRKEQLDI